MPESSGHVDAVNSDRHRSGGTALVVSGRTTFGQYLTVAGHSTLAGAGGLHTVAVKSI
jgi:hypothetical protein